MLSRFLFLALLTSHAAAGELTFKGLPLGATRAEAIASLELVGCAPEARMCAQYASRLTYAGYRISYVRAYFADGRFVGIDFAISPGAVFEASQVFADEHGAPAIHEQVELQSRGGAKVTGTHRVWRLAGGATVETDTYYSSLNSGRIRLFLPAGIAAEDAVASETKQRAKKDM